MRPSSIVLFLLFINSFNFRSPWCFLPKTKLRTFKHFWWIICHIINCDDSQLKENQKSWVSIWESLTFTISPNCKIFVIKCIIRFVKFHFVVFDWVHFLIVFCEHSAMETLYLRKKTSLVLEEPLSFATFFRCFFLSGNGKY